MNKFLLPTSRKVCPLFKHFAQLGSHFSYKLLRCVSFCPDGSRFAQNTTNNLCSYSAGTHPFLGYVSTQNTPKPTQKHPFSWPELESGQNEIQSGQFGKSALDLGEKIQSSIVESLFPSRIGSLFLSIVGSLSHSRLGLCFNTLLGLFFAFLLGLCFAPLLALCFAPVLGHCFTVIHCSVGSLFYCCCLLVFTLFLASSFCSIFGSLFHSIFGS